LTRPGIAIRQKERTMPRDLFGDVTRPSISIGNRKWYTVPLSLFTHSLAVGLVIALPLLAPAVMPAVFADGPTWIVENPPPPPPIKKIETQPEPLVRPAYPTEPLTGIAPERPQPESGWEPTAAGSGIVFGDAEPSTFVVPPPSPPPPPRDPVRIGGQIRPPQKTHDVRPVYPPLALAARVEGIVIIEATIGVDGRVLNARVLRSVPLLDQAALDAVRQWAYAPTTLNGVEVPVIMSVTVTFTLR
jgi:protein TonB